jgi:hypothetical protein
MLGKSWTVVSGLILVAIVSGWFSISRGGDAPPANQPSVRIGTYDPRAIAMAYVGSDMFRNIMAKHREAYDAAKAANDIDAQHAQQEWGRLSQTRIHLQGFGGAPVDDILDQVRDAIPQVATDAGVQVITSKADYAGSDVELIDVTDKLVALFHPSAKTLKTIAGLRKMTPIPLEQLAGMPANQ